MTSIQAPTSHDLHTWIVALEVLSLALFATVGVWVFIAWCVEDLPEICTRVWDRVWTRRRIERQVRAEMNQFRQEVESRRRELDAACHVDRWQ